jgi:hypothetical protein
VVVKETKMSNVKKQHQPIKALHVEFPGNKVHNKNRNPLQALYPKTIAKKQPDKVEPWKQDVA